MGQRHCQASMMIKLILLFFVFLICGLDAQQVCSDNGNAKCLETSQTCLSDGTTESCGNCAAGYIDFGLFNFRTKGCQNITDLPWDAYFDRFQPQYRNVSESLMQMRRKILYVRLQLISQWNAQVPPPSYYLGVNKFGADLDDDRKQLARTLANENASLKLGWSRFEMSSLSSSSSGGRLLQNDLPSVQDWQANGGTTYVKDQGRCGGCWSISNMGAVEGATFVTEGYIQSLSFQQLLSCDEMNSGCEGGNICYAMRYSVKNDFGGLASLNDYPYVDGGGSTTSPCELKTKNVSVEVYSPQIVVTYSDYNMGFDERMQKLKEATARQPVSVAMSSNCDTFSSYRKGVITDDGDCACQTVDCIDHAVLLVGYDDNNNPPFWKLKNSWGTDWGEGGYFRVSQEGGGVWGLFGLLGEGVIALKAVNTTAEQADVPPPNQLSWWAILLIVIAALIAVVIVVIISKRLCCRKR